jgi:hypothetical protein
VASPGAPVKPEAATQVLDLATKSFMDWRFLGLARIVYGQTTTARTQPETRSFETQ